MFDPFLRRKEPEDFESLEEALEVLEHRESYRYLPILVIIMNVVLLTTLTWFDRTIVESGAESTLVGWPFNVLLPTLWVITGVAAIQGLRVNLNIRHLRRSIDRYIHSPEFEELESTARPPKSEAT